MPPLCPHGAKPRQPDAKRPLWRRATTQNPLAPTRLIGKKPCAREPANPPLSHDPYTYDAPRRPPSYEPQYTWYPRARTYAGPPYTLPVSHYPPQTVRHTTAHSQSPYEPRINQPPPILPYPDHVKCHALSPYSPPHHTTSTATQPRQHTTTTYPAYTQHQQSQPLKPNDSPAANKVSP